MQEEGKLEISSSDLIVSYPKLLLQNLIIISGLYRVNYDSNNWQKIGDYLKGPSRQNIHKLNRAQVRTCIYDFNFFY